LLGSTEVSEKSVETVQNWGSSDKVSRKLW